MSRMSNNNTIKAHYPKKDEIILSMRNKVPYKEIKKSLKRGQGVFLEGIKRQTAHYAEKKISKDLKVEYVAVPAYVQLNNPERTVKGYTFEKRSELG